MRKYIDKYEKLFSDIGIALLFICIIFLSINKAKSQLHCTLNTVQTTQYLSQVQVAHNPQWVAALNQFVISEINDNNFYLLDRLWAFNNDNQQAARVSIVNPTSTQITEEPNGGTLTWTKNVGYTGDGTNSYLNSNYNPYTQGVNFTLNNNSFGDYVYNFNGDHSRYDMGSYDGTNLEAFESDARNSNGWSVLSQQGNQNNYLYIYPASFEGIPGLYVATRISGSNLASSVPFYYNGTSYMLTNYNSGSFASSAIPNLSMYIIGINAGNRLSDQDSRTKSMAFFGSGSINQAKLYNAWAKFLNSL